MISKQAHAFCKDDISKIENYEEAINDKSQCWDCHHRTEIWWNCSSQELIDNECYYHRPAKELIFLTRAEHIRLHAKYMTEEHKRKISESAKGRTLSEEHRRKISATMKGHKCSEECRRKMSAAKKGKKGRTLSEETKRKISAAKKGRTRSEETKRKISESAKRRWRKE